MTLLCHLAVQVRIAVSVLVVKLMVIVQKRAYRQMNNSNLKRKETN